MLVVEGHDVAAGGQPAERLEVVVRADHDIVDDLGRGLVGRVRQDPQADAERRGRSGAHPRQLASAHDAHTRGAVEIHERNLLRGVLHFDACPSPPNRSPGAPPGWSRACTRRSGRSCTSSPSSASSGPIAFVIDVGLFNLLLYFGPLQDKPLTAKVVSVVAATTFAYFGNRFWTYRNRGRRSMRREYVLFFVFNGIALLISVGCLWFSHYVLGLDSPLADNISANVVGVLLGTLFRFVAYRTWVFPALPDDAGRSGAGRARRGHPHLIQVRWSCSGAGLSCRRPRRRFSSASMNS